MEIGSVCVCVWERGRERERERESCERRGHRLTEECYIELFLIQVLIPYSGPYPLDSLTWVSQPGSTGGHLAPTPYGRSLFSQLVYISMFSALASLWSSWLPESLLLNRLWRTVLSVGTRAFRLPFWLFSCLESWNIRFKIPNDESVKGQYATQFESECGIFERRFLNFQGFCLKVKTIKRF